MYHKLSETTVQHSSFFSPSPAPKWKVIKRVFLVLYYIFCSYYDAKLNKCYPHIVWILISFVNLSKKTDLELSSELPQVSCLSSSAKSSSMLNSQRQECLYGEKYIFFCEKVLERFNTDSARTSRGYRKPLHSGTFSLLYSGLVSTVAYLWKSCSQRWNSPHQS